MKNIRLIVLILGLFILSAAFVFKGSLASTICVRNTPTVTVTPQTQSGSAGTWLYYTVSVTNNDVGSGCMPQQFNLFEIYKPAG